MRIDLPLCSFKYCKYCLDGNCTGKEIHRERCDFLEKASTIDTDLTSAEIEAMKAENRKQSAGLGAIHTIFTQMSNVIFNYSQYKHVKPKCKDNPSEPLDWMIDFCKEYQNYTGKNLDIRDFRENT